jgi:chromosome segregation ATPase
MFEMLTRMERVTDKLVDSMSNLKEMAEDHEDRLRAVESRADVETRIIGLETRVSQHDAAFTKTGEKIGSVETEIATLQGHHAAKVSPWVVATVVAAFASIVVNIILASI